MQPPCKLLVEEEIIDEEEQLGQYGLKKLNLNIPLLSVRRRLLLVARTADDHDESRRGRFSFSRHDDDNRNNNNNYNSSATATATAAAVNSSSSEEGQHEGVPFSWEQSPGKPKLLLKLKLKLKLGSSSSSINNNINHIEEDEDEDQQHDQQQQHTSIIINPCKSPPGRWTNNWRRYHHQLDDDQNKYHVKISPRDTYSTNEDGDCDVGLINHDGRGSVLTSNMFIDDDNHVDDDDERSDHHDHSHRLSQALSSAEDDDAVVDVASLSEAIDILERARAHHHHQLINYLADDDDEADHHISSSPSFLINRFLPDANALAEEYYSSFCAHQNQNQLIISRSSSGCSDDFNTNKLVDHHQMTTCRNTCSSSSISNYNTRVVDNFCHSYSGCTVAEPPLPPPVQLASRRRRSTNLCIRSNTSTNAAAAGSGGGCGLDNIFSSWHWRTKCRSINAHLWRHN